MTELPKEFYIKRDINNHLWKYFIDWLNEKHNRSFDGVLNYYGESNNKPQFENWLYLLSGTEITLEEWDRIVNKTLNQMKEIEFSVQNMKDTIAMACKDWKPVLAKEFGESVVLELPKKVSITRFEEYLSASTDDQKAKFKQMFPAYFKKDLPDIKVDTLIYVRSSIYREWNMRYFKEFNPEGEAVCFDRQLKSTETNRTCAWNEYSLTNPLT